MASTTPQDLIDTRWRVLPLCEPGKMMGCSISGGAEGVCGRRCTLLLHGSDHIHTLDHLAEYHVLMEWR